eukprot:TRINITY_DN11371_c0_g1_i2.p1 TRINITY_DN11371_c0_g1~~TRINITY_DN11371_c0_g1_i2.p1  ORF type:complete len:144 (-),score=27.35 TRINITY_DN11371_c0_g1_i2:167-598(-)
MIVIVIFVFVRLFFFFFFKQKTAYEMLRSLVGSEMCIRDRGWSWKEIAFLPLVWLGKGSVQAATGGVALETAKILLKNLPDSATVEEIADAERMVEAGRIILNTASLYVLVAAPLCAICITRLGPILLTKPISSIAHHQPGGR